MHKHNIKLQKSRGYASGLVWVKYNQKLAFHLCNMTPGIIFSATLVDSSIHYRPYYGMQCDAEIMQQLINKATTTLKTEYILRTNKVALMTNVLIYVSTLLRKVLFPNKCFQLYNSKVLTSVLKYYCSNNILRTYILYFYFLLILFQALNQYS